MEQNKPILNSGARPVFSPETAVNKPLQATDFEAFARAIDLNQSLTTWPPVGPMREETYRPDWNLADPAFPLDTGQSVDAPNMTGPR